MKIFSERFANRACPFLEGGPTTVCRLSKREHREEGSRILIVGGHARQIQKISSIARSLSGGTDVELTATIAGVQERLVRGKEVHWVVAAIRPFDPSYVNSLRDLQCRAKGRCDAQRMA